MGAVKPQQKGRSMEERRLFRRVVLSGVVEIAHQGSDFKGTATLGDISKSGARLEISDPLSVDSVLSMRLNFFDNHQQRVTEGIIGRVVRCNGAKEGSYIVGVQFIQPVNPKKAPFLFAYVDQ
jgi:hypothetical protein